MGGDVEQSRVGASLAPPSQRAYDRARQAIEHGDALQSQNPAAASNSQPRQALQQAEACYLDALRLLDAHKNPDNAEWNELSGFAWMNRGNALLATDTPEGLKGSIACYQKAIPFLDRLVKRDPSKKIELAALWANIGQALFRSGQRSEFAYAARCFKGAIRIQKALPWQREPRYRFHLAATLANLASLLQIAPEANTCTTALSLFDDALETSEGLDISNHQFRLFLGGLLSNRALHLQASRGAAAKQAVHASLQRAVATLASDTDNATERQQLELASALANLANLSLEHAETLDEIEAARDAATQALRYTGPSRDAQLLSAEISLRALRAQCQADGIRIDQLDAAAQEESHCATTSLIEDGLELAKRWRDRGITTLEPATKRLIRLGCQYYRHQQPHFLAEFIEESLACVINDPEHLAFLADQIDQALTKATTGTRIELDTAEADRLFAYIDDLKRLQQRLAS